jgi:hypothetical protein
MPPLSPEVVETLARVAQEMTMAQGRWWLIGGVACALHGLAIEVADIDVIMSARDAECILSGLRIAPEESSGTDRFRSDVFGRWKGLPLQVDLMAGFTVRTRDGWIGIEPATREEIPIGGHSLYIPARRELVDILRLFGRPKDITRAQALAML